jgi:hypothetical protein
MTEDRKGMQMVVKGFTRQVGWSGWSHTNEMLSYNTLREIQRERCRCPLGTSARMHDLSDLILRVRRTIK